MKPADDRGRDRGQATVEFALALPLVVIAVLLVVQVAIVVSDQLAVGLAAREAARAAAVSADPQQAARAAVADNQISVRVVDTGQTVTATASRPVSGRVPLLGSLFGDHRVESSVTMQVEPP